MVKKKTTRQKVREKSAKQELKDSKDHTLQSIQNVENVQHIMVNNATPKVQKKIAKQLRFLARLQEGATLSARRTISKKKKPQRHGRERKAIDVSSLAEFLPELNETSKGLKEIRASKVLRNKARQKVVAQETKQLAAVLAHKSFQSDPFSAIQQHLVNTLPSPTIASTNIRATNKKHKKQKKHKNKPLDEIMDTA